MQVGVGEDAARQHNEGLASLQRQPHDWLWWRRAEQSAAIAQLSDAHTHTAHIWGKRC